MEDDLKDEIETLESVYSDDELKIKYGAQSTHIAYTAKLEISTEINVGFNINNTYSISVTNSANTKKIIPPNILSQIESILKNKYQETMDSMPIFQCISFCNDELLDDQSLNLVEELHKIKPKLNEEDISEAFWSEVDKYRKEFKKNGGSSIKYKHKSIGFCINSNDYKKININNTAISEEVKEILSKNRYLWTKIPSMHNIRSWLEDRYSANDFEIQFIASYSNIERFLHKGSNSKKFSVVFHGTSSCNDSSIIDNGLVVGGTKGVAIANGSAYGCGVYCSPSLDTARGYARGSMFICLVKKCGCNKNGSIYVVRNDNDILPIYLASFFIGDNVGSYSNAFLNRVKWQSKTQRKTKAKQ